MKLYDYRQAPNARRLRMFLAEKDLSLPVEQIDIVAGENLTDRYLALNPTGLVPALETDEGAVIGESLAICRYLESYHPEPNLMGTTPLETAQIEGWDRRIESSGILPIAWAFREGTDTFVNRAIPGTRRELAQIPALADRGRALGIDFLAMLDARLADTPWIAGERFTNADITAFVACQFARWIGLDAAGAGPSVAGWFARMRERPSAKA